MNAALPISAASHRSGSRTPSRHSTMEGLSALRRAASSPGQIARDAGEDRQAEPVVEAKGAKAAFTRAAADERVVPGGEPGGNREPDQVRHAEADLPADHGPEKEKGRVARHHGGDVEAAERDRRRLDADLQVVVAVRSEER